jgi:hypothetical protein
MADALDSLAEVIVRPFASSPFLWPQHHRAVVASLRAV